MEITVFPAIISHPGKYYITSNVVFSSVSNVVENVITVNACNVTIDLMGNSISVMDSYRLKNRFINLIYSEKSICVNNGTLGLCSGYSIKCDKDVHCNGITFTQYELGAVKASYISLDNCIVLSPIPTNTTVNYDTSAKLIMTTMALISKYSSVLTVQTISQMTVYATELQNLLDFALISFNNGIYYGGLFTLSLSYRTTGILEADKVKMCNTQITIPNIGNYIYDQERLTTPTGEIVRDISGLPLQYTYTSSGTVNPLGDLTSYTSTVVASYDLPYPRMPQAIIDDIIVRNLVIPPGYNITGIALNIVVIKCSNLKMYNTTVVVEDSLTSIEIESSRYVRCHNCTIGGKFYINSSKSIKISGSTITYIVIYNPLCIELCDNIIKYIVMHNSNVLIKSK